MATVNNSTPIDYTAYNAPVNKAKSSAEDIQNRFLKLLTTQLKTQDPSNPMDNAQMTSQMAQISTVSGLESVNQSIKSLTDNQTSSQALLATMMIGRHAMLPGNDLKLQDGTAKALIDLPQSATGVVVTIRNASGAVVNEMKLGPQRSGQMTVSWDGKSTQGTLQPDGQYAVSVAAVNGNTAVEASVLKAVRISSVAMDKGNTSLVLETGQRMSVTDVRQII